MAFTVIHVNAWELRCIFNQSRIVQRAAAGEFTVIPRKKKAGKSKHGNHPPGTTSNTYAYLNAQQDEIATAHWYTFPDGRTSPPDPKTVLIRSNRYQINPDPKVANPEDNLRFLWMKLAYGKAQRLICSAFGARDVLP